VGHNFAPTIAAASPSAGRLRMIIRTAHGHRVQHHPDHLGRLLHVLKVLEAIEGR
jgi:hypothetical protein